MRLNGAYGKMVDFVQALPEIDRAIKLYYYYILMVSMKNHKNRFKREFSANTRTYVIKLDVKSYKMACLVLISSFLPL